MHPQKELTISEELKKIVLFQKKSVQMQQYSFGDEGKTKSSSRYKSRTELMSSYAAKEMHSLAETKNLLPRVRKLINQKTSLISTCDAERNTLKFVVVSDKKMSEMEVMLDKISVLDKIQLHKQTIDVIYSYLLHATMKINKLQSLVDKMEIQSKHHKVGNKANLIQIMNLQGDIISLGIEPNNVQATKKLLEEKDNTIQVLKKKLNIPNTEHVQSSELFTLQEEKEKFY